MATVPETVVPRRNDYPTSDGKPMAETDRHRDQMIDLIETLKIYYELLPRVYVSGNLLIFYERGNKRRHISPDVFVVKGIAKGERLNYLLWEERKGPDLVIELTSSSTRHEDRVRKFRLYQDTLRVREYFLFDPFGDYLDPSLQGYRLRQDVYHPIRPVEGRLPSQVLGLHLERHDNVLRLYDPRADQWVPTPTELRERAEAGREQAEAGRRRAEAEAERLRRENEELRRRLSEQP